MLLLFLLVLRLQFQILSLQLLHRLWLLFWAVVCGARGRLRFRAVVQAQPQDDTQHQTQEHAEQYIDVCHPQQDAGDCLRGLVEA